MINDTSTPEFESLLTPRLLNGVPLVATPEKDRWRIIGDTVDAMYKVFTGKVLNSFNQQAAEVFDIDLGDMIEAIDNLLEKRKGHVEILHYLRICRAQAGLAAQFYGVAPTEHAVALQAMMDLQENLQNALDYIRPINDELNNGSSITT